MNYDLLNNMIDYIEENLTEDIKYKDLAKIVGVSEYSLQRIFMFLAGISLFEYIRKRRLSKAFEELKTTNIKVIDLALKYQFLELLRNYLESRRVNAKQVINNLNYFLF